MAEEFVGMAEFGGFVKRMEERFNHVEKEFGHVNELAEQRHKEVNQRFDDLKEGMRDIRADMRQMRAWLIWLFGLVVFGFIGSIVLMMLRNVVQ